MKKEETIEKLLQSHKEAIELIKYFVNRVNEGTIRSKKTYAKYNSYLEDLEDFESEITALKQQGEPVTTKDLQDIDKAMEEKGLK